MRTLVLDTHALVWFLQNSVRLPVRAKKAIASDQNFKLIPFIAICEIHYLSSRGRFSLSAEVVVAHLVNAAHFEIVPHAVNQLQYMMSGLEMHDSLIVATAKEAEVRNEQKVLLVSKDGEILQKSGLDVLWD